MRAITIAAAVTLAGLSLALVLATPVGVTCMSPSQPRDLGLYRHWYDVRPALCWLEATVPVPLWALGLVGLAVAASIGGRVGRRAVAGAPASAHGG